MTSFKTFGLLALCVAMTCLAASADTLPTLGAAGTFTVIGVGNSTLNVTAGKVNNSNIYIEGDEGVGYGGTLVNMAPSTITGDAYQYQAGQYSGPGILGGVLKTDPTLMNQAYLDAVAAATFAAGMTTTQTFTLTSNALTITGNGGINVIQLNGDIKNTITLNGGANDYWVINVSGGLQLTGSTILGENGIASHILWNFTSSGKNLSTHVDNTMYGTMLALNDNYSNMDGTWYGGIIGGGDINLLSASHVYGGSGGSNLWTPPANPVPEPGTLAMLGTGVLGLAGIMRRKIRS